MIRWEEIHTICSSISIQKSVWQPSCIMLYPICAAAELLFFPFLVTLPRVNNDTVFLLVGRLFLHVAPRVSTKNLKDIQKMNNIW